MNSTEGDYQPEFSTQIKKGIEIYKSIQQDLSKLDQWYPRTQYQKDMHELILNACLPQIFGSVIYESKKEFITKELNLNNKTQHSRFLFLWPRRFGKDFALCQFAAVILKHLPIFNTVICANARRSGQDLLDKIYRMVDKIGNKNLSNTILSLSLKDKMRQSSLGNAFVWESYFHTEAKDFNEIDTRLIFVNEAAFIGKSDLNGILSPFLNKKNVVVVLISSDNQEGFTKYLETNYHENDGTPIFLISETFSACNECSTKGIFQFKECMHGNVKLPPWIAI